MQNPMSLAAAANTLHGARNRTEALVNLLYQGDGINSARFQSGLDATIAELTSLRTKTPVTLDTAAGLPFFSD